MARIFCASSEYKLSLCFRVSEFPRVEEYISQGKDRFIVDPDPNLLYTKRKLAKQRVAAVGENIATSSAIASSSVVSFEETVRFPDRGWGNRLEKMPLFTKAEVNRFIANSGKLLGSSHHSVPTSWKKGKTFLEDEYLKDIECTSDDKHFYFRCRCHHSFRKNDDPHVLRLALCIVSGEVVQSTCSCVTGKTGYCNHALALMLKLCNYSLYESKSTLDLHNDPDQNPNKACTSRLQTWHRKGRGDTIVPQPVMDIIVKKTKLTDDEPRRDGLKCLLYEARNNAIVQETEEKKFKDTLRSINPNLGLAKISSNHVDSVDTKFGRSPVGSFSSYQLSITESNFDVSVNIDTVPRSGTGNQQIERFPRFPLRNQGDSDGRDLSNEKKEFVKRLYVDEDDDEYEPEAVHAYMKYMNDRSTPVEVFKSGLVVYKKEPVLACSPDGKVFDPGSTKPFGLVEVKCPETKFLVTPLDACSDINFCCENIDGKCKLKATHPYYAQVQGQMGVTGADWCDFVVYTKKGMSIERIPFDSQYWYELEGKLLRYYYENFINFAITEAL